MPSSAKNIKCVNCNNFTILSGNYRFCNNNECYKYLTLLDYIPQSEQYIKLNFWVKHNVSFHDFKEDFEGNVNNEQKYKETYYLPVNKSLYEDDDKYKEFIFDHEDDFQGFPEDDFNTVQENCFYFNLLDIEILKN